VVNKKKPELLEAIFADTFRTHILLDNTQENNTQRSQEGFFTYLFNAFPDIHYTIGDLIVEGNRIVARVKLTANHKTKFA